MDNKMPLIAFEHVSKDFPLSKSLLGRVKQVVRAVKDVTLIIEEGTTVGVVGESGSGKTTLARLLLRLEEPTTGSILYKGRELSILSTEELKQFRRDIQAVFQNPFSSLNPRMKVWEIVGEPLIANDLARASSLHERVGELLEMVGLRRDDADRYPHQFSGGQRQRIAIARALSSGARLIVLDEPVSSLDVSIRAQILNLLRELKRQFSLTYVFIAHDLNLVYYMAEQVIVMYLGMIVEAGKTEQVFLKPLHPYTEALLSAAPVPDPDRRWAGEIVEGDPLEESIDKQGCIFMPRCKYVTDRCRWDVPSLSPVEPGRFSACHLKAAPSRFGVSI